MHDLTPDCLLRAPGSAMAAQVIRVYDLGSRPLGYED